VYRCADGEEIAVGALEPAFFASLLAVLGLDPAAVPGQADVDRWPELRAALTDAFASRPRAEWLARAEGRDACVAPVLTMRQAAQDAHVRARATVVEVDGALQPSPAPRFSATPTALDRPPPVPGQHTDEILWDLGCTSDEIAALRQDGVVA
jgi:alpha-methylacyl-CoA racemase